jgi:hypothetical protein
MIVDQLLDPVMRDQEIPAPEKSQHGAPGDREDIVALQSAPDGFELQNTLQGGIAGVIGAIEGADAGADHHIGGNSVGGQRMHHANLDGAETAAACEYKSRFGGLAMTGYRQAWSAPGYAASQKPRDVRGPYSRRGAGCTINVGC